MADVFDYLRWRGDLNMMVDPLNEVDVYILSKFGIPDYTGIIPENGGLTLSEAMQEFNRRTEGKTTEEIIGYTSPNNLPVIRILPGTARFGNLYVSDFVRRISEQEDRQFSAVTIDLPDGTKMVTFRGTDDYFVSWKEDLLLTSEEEIPSHRDAIDYLIRESEKTSRPIIVCGHSKGGNLAEYASMKVPEDVQNRITAIFNFDGPGFNYDLNDREEFIRIRPKIRKLVSHESIVGRLLTESADYEIVHTEETGWRAHDGFNWSIQRTTFERGTEFSRVSNALEAGFNGTVANIEPDRRKQFLDDLFNTLYENDVHQFSDLNRKKLQDLSSLSSEMFRSPEVQTLITQLSKAYLQETVSTITNALPAPPPLPKPSLLKNLFKKGDHQGTQDENHESEIRAEEPAETDVESVPADE